MLRPIWVHAIRIDVKRYIILFPTALFDSDFH